MASRRKVQGILKNLDFEKIHGYMESVGWKWSLPYYPYRMEVPTVERIKEFVAEHVAKVMDSEEDSVIHSCGGFWIIKNGSQIAVLFAIESYDSW